MKLFYILLHSAEGSLSEAVGHFYKFGPYDKVTYDKESLRISRLISKSGFDLVSSTVEVNPSESLIALPATAEEFKKLVEGYLGSNEDEDEEDEYDSGLNGENLDYLSDMARHSRR